MCFPIVNKNRDKRNRNHLLALKYDWYHLQKHLLLLWLYQWGFPWSVSRKLKSCLGRPKSLNGIAKRARHSRRAKEGKKLGKPFKRILMSQENFRIWFIFCNFGGKTKVSGWIKLMTSWIDALLPAPLHTEIVTTIAPRKLFAMPEHQHNKDCTATHILICFLYRLLHLLDCCRTRFSARDKRVIFMCCRTKWGAKRWLQTLLISLGCKIKDRNFHSCLWRC